VHILVTTDTLTPVWTYTQELVSGLMNRGVRVTLVSFGDIPLRHQTSWMDALQNLDYRPTAFQLDWMQEGQLDLEDSSRYLTSLAKELKPDLLHLNHLCHGSLPVETPRIVAAHGDLITWWLAVHGHEPKDSAWVRWYRNAIAKGISEANIVVAPSAWMLDAIQHCYVRPACAEIVHPGRNPIGFNPYVSKDDYVLAIGRLVDPGKQVALLTQCSHPMPVCIVDAQELPAAPDIALSSGVKLKVDESNISLKRAQTEAQIRMLFSKAAIFVAAGRYEPLGLPVISAALSRCAIVANDVPCFREVWGDAAIYFQTNDADSLADVIRRLHGQRDLCRGYGARAFQRARDCYTGARMVDQYLKLYNRTLTAQTVAA
jgi:glycogen synthase